MAALTTRTSDVKAHAACPRSWYYRAVVDVATRTSTAAQKGTIGHADVERWLQAGTAPVSKAGKLLVQGLQRLCDNNVLGHYIGAGTAAGKDWKGDVEWHWTTAIEVAGKPVTYHGTADLVLWETDADGLGAMVPVIIDHKTRGSMDLALDADALVADWQANAYAWAAMERTGGNVVYFIHNNICERDSTVRPVAVRMERDQVRTVWLAHVVREVEKMLGHAQAERAEEVPADVTGEACSAYGGCPYKNRCGAWTMRTIGTPPVLEKPMALMSYGKTAAPAATPANAPTPAQPPASAPVVAQQPPPQATERPPATSPASHDPETGEVAGFALLINCSDLPRAGQLPVGLVSLDQHLAEMTAYVCNKRGVDHHSQVKFGEAKADVLAMLAVNLPPTGATVVVDTSDELQRAALEVLYPHAGRVIRGWK